MSDLPTTRLATALERIVVLLAAVFAEQLKGSGQAAQAERLRRCGFSNVEIANVLGTSPNAIAVALHKARRVPKPPPKSARRVSPRSE